MKTFLKEVLLPLLLALCLAALFNPVYMKDGVCDYFLLWLCVGFPFGAVSYTHLRAHET